MSNENKVNEPRRPSVTALQKALDGERTTCQEAIDRLREMATPTTEDEIYNLTRDLRVAVTLLGSLRTLVQGRTDVEIHQAFGAPGDFGYHTPLGEALSELYHPRRGPQ